MGWVSAPFTKIHLCLFTHVCVCVCVCVCVIQKELLEKAMAEQKPLKEQLAKQGVRVNSLNASLHDRERAIKRVTEENEELVSLSVFSVNNMQGPHFSLCVPPSPPSFLSPPLSFRERPTGS